MSFHTPPAICFCFLKSSVLFLFIIQQLLFSRTEWMYFRFWQERPLFLHFVLFVKCFGKLSTEKHCENTSLLFLQQGITGSAVDSLCEQVPKSCQEILTDCADSLRQMGCVSRAPRTWRVQGVVSALGSWPGSGRVSKSKIYTRGVHKAQVLKAQPPGKWMGFGFPSRLGAQFRSKLREPSAC